jgi:hypothetical protein
MELLLIVRLEALDDCIGLCSVVGRHARIDVVNPRSGLSLMWPM